MILFSLAANLNKILKTCFISLLSNLKLMTDVKLNTRYLQ